MDTVTLIRQEEAQWRVWVCSQEAPLPLTLEEQRVIATYVQRHTHRRAYFESQRQSSSAP
jgi:hypothetical protein